MSYLIDGLKNYVNFEGRATRKQFWIFSLWIFLFSFVALIIDFIIGTDAFISNYGLVSSIFGLATFLPCLAIAIRRLHDIGKNGLWVLINLIPVIGFVILVVLFCKRGDPEENEYGLPVGYSATEDHLES